VQKRGFVQNSKEYAAYRARPNMQLKGPVQPDWHHLHGAWLSILLVGYESSVHKIFTFFLNILKADFSNVKILEHTNCLHILSSYIGWHNLRL
jgi:hypothetical protein